MKRAFNLRINLYLILTFLALSGTINNLYAQKIINLSDYGVIPDSYQNASANIARAIKDVAGADSCVILFPGGRIDLWPEGAPRRTYYISNATEDDSIPKLRTIGMLFENLSNITLKGNNTLLVYHGKMMLMAIDHCENFRVQDLLFDFQRPTMSEMTIVAETDTNVIADVHRDSWYAIENHNGHRQLIWYGEGWRTNNAFAAGYRPSDETMYYTKWAPFEKSNAVELSPGKVQFSGNFENTNFRVGDVLTIRDPYRDEVGVFNNQSRNIVFQNLKFYYIHGLGIVSQLSENITIVNVAVAPETGSGRVVAAFADCFHFSGCYGQVVIKNCLASGTHDDPVNIHGTYLRIMKADSNKTIVRFMHHQTWGFNAFGAGDTIGFVNHRTLLSFGDAIVKSSRMISKKEIELVLDRPVPENIREDDCIENISKTASAIIKNNRFQHVLTRGILVTTRKPVMIEDNIFYKTRLHAILVAGDCNSWFESGPVKDLTIRNNKFMDCAYGSFPNDYVIEIKPESHQFEKKLYVHSNISITGNTFKIFDAPLLTAFNVKALNFSGNKIIQKNAGGFPVSDNPSFNLVHSDNVLIQNNNFTGGPAQKVIKISDMKKNMIKYSPPKEYWLLMDE